MFDHYKGEKVRIRIVSDRVMGWAWKKGEEKEVPKPMAETMVHRGEAEMIDDNN